MVQQRTSMDSILDAFLMTSERWGGTAGYLINCRELGSPGARCRLRRHCAGSLPQVYPLPGRADHAVGRLMPDTRGIIRPAVKSSGPQSSQGGVRSILL